MKIIVGDIYVLILFNKSVDGKCTYIYIYIHIYMETFTCVCICFKSVKTTLSEKRMGKNVPLLCFSCTAVIFMQYFTPENYPRPVFKLNC